MTRQERIRLLQLAESLSSLGAYATTRDNHAPQICFREYVLYGMTKLECEALAKELTLAIQGAVAHRITEIERKVAEHYTGQSAESAA